MKITLRVAMGAVVMAALAACQPTGSTRCDDVLKGPIAVATYEGYRIDCTPEPLEEPPGVIGWADHEHRTLYVWQDRISLDKTLIKVAWHEVGHVVGRRLGTNSEAWADGYAHCREPLAGVSYLSKPTNCEPYLR